MKNNNFDIIEALWLRKEKKRRAQKIIEGAPPLTFKVKEGTLKNYRIYGQTVDGESVGDLVTEGEHAGEYKVPVTVGGKNILPMSTTPISTDVDDFHCEYDGTGTITLTTDKDNAVLSGFSVPLSEVFIIPVSIGQGGNGCFQMNNSEGGTFSGNFRFMYNNTTIDSWSFSKINRIVSSYSGMDGKTTNSIRITITNFNTVRKLVIKPAFVLNTTEQVPFEPYHAPVTTPIYLPEQIRKVGDEAEYIDYAEQKQHFADGTSVDVTLPALPTIAGTNTLSVGTQVQPSSVKIEGKIKGVS